VGGNLRGAVAGTLFWVLMAPGLLEALLWPSLRPLYCWWISSSHGETLFISLILRLISAYFTAWFTLCPLGEISVLLPDRAPVPSPVPRVNGVRRAPGRLAFFLGRVRGHCLILSSLAALAISGSGFMQRPPGWRRGIISALVRWLLEKPALTAGLHCRGEPYRAMESWTRGDRP